MTMVAEPVRTPEGEPRAVGDIDDSLRATAKGIHRLRWWVTIVVGVAMAAGVIVLAIISLNQQKELEASCGFWASASVVPITVVPPATHPSLEGVKLIADSRIAYYHQGCSPALPPNPSLQRWAGFYDLTYLP